MKLTELTTIFIMLLVILSITFVSSYILGIPLIDWLFTRIVTWIGMQTT